MNKNEISIPVGFLNKDELNNHLEKVFSSGFDSFEYFEADIGEPAWRRTTPAFDYGLSQYINPGQAVVEAISAYNESRQPSK